MCGIVGFVNCSGDFDGAAIVSMYNALKHRGPDDAGHWIDSSAEVAFGFRRLSILDLSPEGHQPMFSPSGRFVTVYNGEVYNYQELTQTLIGLGYKFRGHSDTEVILASIEEWGVDTAVKKFVGMFAIAVWDLKDRVLYLVRDRLGIKPLYYGWNNNTFLFGSELKAFFPHPRFSPEIDRDALALFMQYSYIPAPHSIYKGLFKLWPGSTLCLPLDAVRSGGVNFSPFPTPNGTAFTPKTFWSAKEVLEAGSIRPFTGSEDSAADELEVRLKDAVKLRMIADVPLGAFLSGGVDSSTVVALMQAQSSMPIRTFSIGFNESEYNEAVYAKEVAKFLGTDHTELYLTPKETLDVIPLLPALYDEPFADSSQIPTYLVSKLARKYVTVSLSGDGGDELFCGYPRYTRGKYLWSLFGSLPRSMRKLIGMALRTPSAKSWSAVIKVLDFLLPKDFRYSNPGYKVHRLSHLLDVSSKEAFYAALVSTGLGGREMVFGSRDTRTVFSDSSFWPKGSDYLSFMMYQDLVSYLPDDLLVKVDRASMGVSLEARVPLIDHRVVEFVSTLPVSMKIREGTTKWLLRKVLNKYVPSRLIERPKRGFAVPVDKWLKHDLRAWAEDLLAPSKLSTQGFLDPKMVREKWTEFLEGKADWNYYIWNILMFQAWVDGGRGKPKQAALHGHALEARL